MRLLVFAVISLVCLAGDALAQGQVPQHYPGTICFTPSFWCWSSPGQPGSPLYVSKPPRAGARLSRLKNWRLARRTGGLHAFP